MNLFKAKKIGILSLVVLPFLFGGCKSEPEIPTEVTVTGIVITPSEVTLSVGMTQQMTATLTPEGASNIGELTWSVADTDIATISESGLLTAIAAGETSVLCRVGSVEQTAKIIVKEEPAKPGVTAELKSNTDLKVTFQVTPTQKDAYYNCGVILTQNFNNDKIKGLEGLAESEKGWWEFVTGSSDPKDWQMFWFKGDMLYDSTSKDKGSEVPMLYWDTEYIFYAYMVDEATGDAASDIFLFPFKTPPAKPSGMTFDLKITSASKDNGINGTITPSGDGEYFFFFESARVWNSWKETGYKGNYADSHQNIIYEFLKFDYNPNGTVQGPLTIDKNTQFAISLDRMKQGNEYVLLVWGWDRSCGPTTSIFASESFVLN